MTGIIQGADGKWTYEKKDWGVQDIVKAQRLLNVKYARMEPTPANIQVLIDELTKEFGYDPVQISRVIEEHFKKRKG